MGHAQRGRQCEYQRWLMSDRVGYIFLTVANRMPEVRVDTPMHSAHRERESLVSDIPAGAMGTGKLVTFFTV
jgi:hypothetical protein